MFGYNISTILIILVIVLLLFGPRRLPELGDSIGKAIRSFKKAHDDGPEPLPKEEAKAAPGATAAAAQTKACPQCHKELTQEFAFCPHCGRNLKA
jgi:sec-independent protein translocase protein TatA